MKNHCKNCNKFISKNKEYCSDNCKKEFNKKEILEIKCIICNKIIYKGTSKYEQKRKTCSMKCRDILKKQKKWEIRTCKVCENKFEARKITKKEMCSDECRKIWAAMPENKEYRLQRTKEELIKKYGVDATFKLESVQKKYKKF